MRGLRSTYAQAFRHALHHVLLNVRQSQSLTGCHSPASPFAYASSAACLILQPLLRAYLPKHAVYQSVSLHLSCLNLNNPPCVPPFITSLRHTCQRTIQTLDTARSTKDWQGSSSLKPCLTVCAVYSLSITFVCIDSPPSHRFPQQVSNLLIK